MTPQQQAEEIARKCATVIADRPEHLQWMHDRILSTIPLVELLEVARAAKQYQDAITRVLVDGGWTEANNDIVVTSQQVGARALENLRRKGVEL